MDIQEIHMPIGIYQSHYRQALADFPFFVRRDLLWEERAPQYRYLCPCEYDPVDPTLLSFWVFYICGATPSACRLRSSAFEEALHQYDRMQIRLLFEDGVVKGCFGFLRPEEPCHDPAWLYWLRDPAPQPTYDVVINNVNHSLGAEEATRRLVDTFYENSPGARAIRDAFDQASNSFSRFGVAASQLSNTREVVGPSFTRYVFFDNFSSSILEDDIRLPAGAFWLSRVRGLSQSHGWHDDVTRTVIRCAALSVAFREVLEAMYIPDDHRALGEPDIEIRHNREADLIELRVRYYLPTTHNVPVAMSFTGYWTRRSHSTGDTPQSINTSVSSVSTEQVEPMVPSAPKSRRIKLRTRNQKVENYVPHNEDFRNSDSIDLRFARRRGGAKRKRD